MKIYAECERIARNMLVVLHLRLVHLQTEGYSQEDMQIVIIF